MKQSWYSVAPGKPLRLAEVDPASTGPFKFEREARESERKDAERMRRLQDILMAHETHGLLILFQGMDASGKDESIRDVLSALDARSCEYKQFQRLTEKEARHDYLWRAVAALPSRGQIGIFNRSYYEHVMGDRVHPEKLEEQCLPTEARKDLWRKRFRQINDFEQYLVENGIHVLKLFLHVSREGQRRRLLERIRDPATCWQFSPNDIEERQHWDEYMEVFEKALTETNTRHAPWQVIPSDHLWAVRAAVAALIADKLESLHTEYPELTEEQRRELEQAEHELTNDG